MSACPSREMLALLLAERLTAAETGVVESHVQSCAPCQKTLDELSGEDLLTCGARGKADGSPSRDPPRAVFLERLRQLLPVSCDTGTLHAGSDTIVSCPARPLPQVSGYELLAELGRGGMGVVYKARQTRLGRVVALKMLLAGVHAGPPEVARFRMEAEALARLQNPHIVQVFDVGEENGCPFLALEYVEGGSLSDKVRAAPLPGPAAARLVAVLASAVHAAHQSGVVHRDLKPANVLLTADDTPKITDFGLAKRLDGASTQSSGLLGTPHYMAPEQADGRPVGPAADVYGLGAILYFLLTGRPPFLAETPLDTILLVRTAEPIAPSVLQPKTAIDLQTICLKCLEKAPERRFASAAALADDLRRFLAGEPIQARPSTRAERLVKWVKRRPGVAVSAAVGVAAAITLIILLIARWQDAETRAHAVQRLDDAQRMILARNLQLTDLGREVEKQQGLVRSQRAEGERLQNVLIREQGEVRQAKVGIRRALYIRDMLRAQTAMEKEQVGELNDLLDRHRPPPGEEDVRGFEWHYLWRLIHGERLALRPGRGPIRTVRFSPDGTTVASLSIDEGTARYGSSGVTLRLWNKTTGAEIPSTWGLLDGVWEFTFSPDGHTLATGHQDGTVRFWDVATGRLRASFKAHDAAVEGLSFSPDGRSLATGSVDKTARIWDVGSFKSRATLPAKQSIVHRVEFSPDGRTLLTIHEGGAILWEIATGRERLHMPIRATSTLMAGAAFSPDGKTIATAEANLRNGPSGVGAVRFWDVPAQKELSPALPIAIGGAFCVAFAPDGESLAVGGENGTIRIFDVATRQLRNTLYGNRYRVHSIAFAPDGKTIATGGNDEILRFWDVNRPVSPVILQDRVGLASLVAIAPDGNTLAAHVGPERGSMAEFLRTSCLKLFDRATGRQRVLTTSHAAEGPISFASDGRTVASAGPDGTALFWDISTGTVRSSLRLKEKARFLAAAFSPEGQTATLGTSDGRIILWDVDTGREMARLQPPPAPQATWPVYTLAFSPNGKALVAGREFGTLHLWDLPTRQITTTLGGEGWSVTSVAYSPDGNLLAAGNWDGVVRLWNLSRLARQAPPWATAALALGAVPGKAGPLSAAAALMTAPAGEKEHVHLDAHLGTASCIVFSPDGKTLVSGHLQGKTLASGTIQGAIKFWDVPTLQERFNLPCAYNMPSALSFTPDGKVLAAGGGFGEVYVWNANTSDPREGSFSGPRLRGTAVADKAARSREQQNQTQVTDQDLIVRIPNSFYFDYNYDPLPGKRLWLRVDRQYFVERYPNGMESRFKILARAKIDGIQGTLVEKASGSEQAAGTSNSGSFRIFVPDRGSAKMELRFRHAGAGPEWHLLGYIKNVE